MLRLIGLSTLLTLRAATVVAPGANTSVEGNSSDCQPYLQSAFCTDAASVRVQTLYPASQLPSGPITITGMRFRPNAGSVPFNTSPNLLITLSTIPIAQALSATFANNVGADVTTVRSGVTVIA